MPRFSFAHRNMRPLIPEDHMALQACFHLCENFKFFIDMHITCDVAFYRFSLLSFSFDQSFYRMDVILLVNIAVTIFVG